MRAILVTLRYPDRRAIHTQNRSTTPTVGVKLLIPMTGHNGIEQVFERGRTQSVSRLHQGRRTDDGLPVVIRQNQMQRVTHRLNRSVAEQRHAKHQPDGPFCRELAATNRSSSRRFKGWRHQGSVEARGEGVEVIKWLIAGRGQQCGAKIHPSS